MTDCDLKAGSLRKVNRSTDIKTIGMSVDIYFNNMYEIFIIG